MSTPIKRKITLELASKKSTLIKDRPSVFQRLGTKKIGRSGSLTQQQQQHQQEHQQQQHQYHSQEGGIAGSESKEEIVKRIVSAVDNPNPSTSGNPVLESVAVHARLIQAQLAAKQLQAIKSISVTGSSSSNEVTTIASATACSGGVTELSSGSAAVAKDRHYGRSEGADEGTPRSQGDEPFHQQPKQYYPQKSSHSSHHQQHHEHQEFQHQQAHPCQRYHHRREEEHQKEQQHQQKQLRYSRHEGQQLPSRGNSRGRVHSLSSDRSSIVGPDTEGEIRGNRRARGGNGATSWDQSSLENADQDILERKRKELQHELKLEMDSSSSKKKDVRSSEVGKKLVKKISGGVSSHHRSQHHQQQHSHHQHSLQQQQRDIGHGHGHGQLQLQQQQTSSSTSESTSSSGSESSETETSSSSSSSSHDSTHRRLKKRSHVVAGRSRRGDSSTSSGTLVATTGVGTISSAASSSKISKKHAKKLAAAVAATHDHSERSKRVAKAKGSGGGSGNGTSVLLSKSIRLKRLHPGSPNGAGGGGGSGGSSSTHHVSRKLSRELSPSGKLSSSSSSKYALAKAKLLSSSSSNSKKEKISAIVARERVRVKERELAMREKEREQVLREKEREREKERLRLREREARERLGKLRAASPPRMRTVAVSPVSSRGGGGGGSLQGKGKKSPERRLSSPMSSSRYREMVPIRRERTPELTRDERRRSHEAVKERERRVREVMRSKERDDLLAARSQDRQRDRDRLSVKEQHQQPQQQQHLHPHQHQHPHQHPHQHQQLQQQQQPPQQQQQQQQQQLPPQVRNLRRDNDGGLEKPDRHRPVERLLPRPAERARALAAARSPGKSVDRDRSRSPGSPGRRVVRDRERSYERNSYLHELHERRTLSRSRERDYVTAHGPPPSMRPSRRDSPPHYERHGPATGRDSSGGGGMRMDYRTERDDLPYVDNRMGPVGGIRGERGPGGGTGRDEYVVRDYPDDPLPRREQHLDRSWDCEPSSRVEARGGAGGGVGGGRGGEGSGGGVGGGGGRYDRSDMSGGRGGGGDWGERGGDPHGPIDPDGPYLGGTSGGSRGGESRGAWDDRPSWKDGPGEPWHSVSERDIPDRGMQVADWKYKERQWEHEHSERGGPPTSGGGGGGGGGSGGGGGGGGSGGGGVGGSGGGGGGVGGGGGGGGGGGNTGGGGGAHGHGGHGLGGHGGPPSRRSWQQSSVGGVPSGGAGGGGASSGAGSGGPASDWLGPKVDHERDFMPHQRPNDRPIFRRHHHQGPYHGHTRKTHIGAGVGGAGNNPSGLVGGGGGMNRFTPNKYSLNRTQANLQANDRNVPGGGAGGGGAVVGLPNHPHAQSHHQTPPVSGGSVPMQPPSAGHHHGVGHSPGHGSSGNPLMQQQVQQSGPHRLGGNGGGGQEPRPHVGVGHQHHHQQTQFGANQQQSPGANSSVTQSQHAHRGYDLSAGGGDPMPVQRRPAPLDAPASPTPDIGESSFAVAPSTPTGAPPVTSPNLLAASSPLDAGIDGALIPIGTPGLTTLDAMEVDNLSEISDDADEILMRDEEEPARDGNPMQPPTPLAKISCSTNGGGCFGSPCVFYDTVDAPTPLTLTRCFQHQQQQQQEQRQRPFLSKARYKSYEDAIIGGSCHMPNPSPSLVELGATTQLCDSISTDRSADSQHAEMLVQETDLEQNAVAAATSVVGVSSQSSAPGADVDGGVVQTDGTTGAVLQTLSLAAAAGKGATGGGDTPVEGYRSDVEQSQAGRDAGKLHANKELKEEMDLDFEEISDGELEAEENRGKAGLGDPLGVDWGSLTQEVLHPLKHSGHRQHSQQFPVSARNRWKAHHILLEIGVSVRLAGASYAQRVLTEAKERLREELEEFQSATTANRAEMARRVTPAAQVLRDQNDNASEVRNARSFRKTTNEELDRCDDAPMDAGRLTNGGSVAGGQSVEMEQSDKQNAVQIKTESPELAADQAQFLEQPATEWKAEGKENPHQGVAPNATVPCSPVTNIERDLEEMDHILHSIAAVHVARRERARLRRNLILPGEPVAGQQHQCGRALSARKDLEIRRQLCGFPPTTMVTMTACAAGSATGFLHQELLADAPLGGGGGTIQPELHADIHRMYLEMMEQQRKQQQSLDISATLPTF